MKEMAKGMLSEEYPLTKEGLPFPVRIFRKKSFPSIVFFSYCTMRVVLKMMTHSYT